MYDVKDETIFYWDILKDSFHYALSDWVAIVILGAVLFLASLLENLFFMNKVHGLLIFLIVFISLLLTVMESGYSFKILEESINGSKRPPIFRDYKELFAHGIKDTAVFSVYIIVLISIFLFCSIVMGISTHNSDIDLALYVLLAAIALLIGGLIYVMLMCALLNLAYHEGKFETAFKFIEILKLMKKIGILRLSVVIFLGFVIEYLVLTSIFDVSLFIHFPPVVNFLINFFVTPFFVIFSERLLALSSL